MTTFLSTRNISLYTVPAAWWLCMVPHVYAFLTYDRLLSPSQSEGKSDTRTTEQSDSTDARPEKSEERFNTTSPRTFLSLLANSPLPKHQKDRLFRAEAASQNGYENLGFYAAAVAASNLAMIVVHANEGGGSAAFAKEVWDVNVSCLGYLATRVAFGWVYIEGWSGVGRGFWFYLGLGVVSRLYIKAGMALGLMVK
jgi:uncharacterized MAPEG superfamily protein